jgi:hypothetical protein
MPLMAGSWFSYVAVSAHKLSFLEASFGIDGGFEPSPDGPSAVTFTLATGGDDGEIDIDITALPVSWGDGAAFDDGLGAIGSIDWWSEEFGWQVLDATPATGVITVTLGITYWGRAVTIKIRAVSDFPHTGAESSDTVTVGGVAMLAYTVVDTDGNECLDSSGNAVVKWVEE